MGSIIASTSLIAFNGNNINVKQKFGLHEQNRKLKQSKTDN